MTHILLAAALLTAGSLVNAASAPQPELCQQLRSFALDLPVGQSRSLSLSASPGSTPLGDMSCTLNNPRKHGEQICHWLAEHSSREFMDVNILRAMACLSGSDFPKGSQLQVKEMRGSFSAFEPFPDLPNIRFEFSYSFGDPALKGVAFYKLTAIAEEEQPD
jgi:hypothetical protein